MNTFNVESFFHVETSTWSHVVYDRETKHAAIIDPVLDYRPEDGHVSTNFADQLLVFIEKNALNLKYLIETHIHADHLSAGAYLREKTQASIVVSKNITQIQRTFSDVFNEPEDFPLDARQFDRLVEEGDCLVLGENTVMRVLETPGHTPACVSFLVNEQAVFIGDTLFMSDTGSARCDFPAGDAGTLYDSVQKLFALKDEVVMYLCHDYPPQGRAVKAWQRVGEQRAQNIHLANKTREEFIALREARDAQLAKPRLILPSLQVNIRAGDFPEPESNGVSYLKVPLNLL